MRRPNRVAALAWLVAAVVLGAAGCGFIAAGRKSVQKPTSFVLIGHADVVLPAGDHRAVGVSCTAPSTVAGIGVRTPVRVYDDLGTQVGAGTLGAGLTGHTGSGLSCDFPFQIPGVPGGSQTYGIAVGNEPRQIFQAADVRQNAAAVLTITPTG
ncbi:MAG TPA: hypothetical protein VKB69_01390 [Micromonosporaceae bacterium]|nr:hypothetical protein [Micromonosporaceae bacterium]